MPSPHQEKRFHLSIAVAFLLDLLAPIADANISQEESRSEWKEILSRKTLDVEREQLNSMQTMKEWTRWTYHQKEANNICCSLPLFSSSSSSTSSSPIPFSFFVDFSAERMKAKQMLVVQWPVRSLIVVSRTHIQGLSITTIIGDIHFSLLTDNSFLLDSTCLW